MKPRIELLPQKKLVGKSIKMSLANNKTFDLWKQFMPKRKEIKNVVSADLYSLQVYNKSIDLIDFNPLTEFTKWAAIEISNFDDVPENFETFILESGLYAVFIHKGSSTDNKTFHYIFTTWLPNSNYLLDDRPHFEILGEKYKNEDPNSEEEIWIPIKPK